MALQSEQGVLAESELERLRQALRQTIVRGEQDQLELAERNRVALESDQVSQLFSQLHLHREPRPLPLRLDFFKNTFTRKRKLASAANR